MQQIPRGALRGAALVHKGLALDLACFLIAPLRAQCIRQQPSGLRLGAMIATRERKCLAAADLGLVRIALREPQPSELDP